MTFTKVSIILPVINETLSLVETVEVIYNNSRRDLLEILIVVADKTAKESFDTITKLKNQYGSLITVHIQKMPFIGGALRECFDLVSGSHVIIMASDLETDPNLVPILISIAKTAPDNIVTVSRWANGGGFVGYSKIKLIANWIFQKIFSLLYWTKLSDMTYAYRIFPVGVLKSINWQQLRHPFLFESIIKPLRIGVNVIEVPGLWRSRTEGVSQNSFFKNFAYFKIGITVRFMSKKKILK